MSVWGLGLFLVGVCLGWAWQWLDQLLYPLYAAQETPSVLAARKAASDRQWGRYLQLAWQLRQPLHHLLSRSIIFILLYVVLAIFIVTSTASWLGMGLVIGLGARYGWQLYRALPEPSVFQTLFLWQVHRKFPAIEMQRLVLGYLVIYGILVVIIARQLLR